MGSFCNSKKEIGLDWQKNNFARASRFLVQFHSPALSSRWAQHKNFLFFSLNLDTVHSDSTQKISPTFDKLNEIK